MRYALVNGERIEAQPKLLGKCHICSCPTTAKCGEIRIWHWAHNGQVCDLWLEKETEWHRAWQSCFPEAWHEAQQENNGIIHIVDVKTQQGWSINFQHSKLKSEDIIERSVFYKKLIWVVNGMRRIRDKEQFLKLLNERTLVRSDKPRVWKVYLDQCDLLKEWSGLSAPVFFDFGEETLWCLLSAGQNGFGYIVLFSRAGFIKLHNEVTKQEKNFEYWLNQLNNRATQYTIKQSEMLKPHISGLPMYLVKNFEIRSF